MKKWEDKTCVKKGNYGEALCDTFLINKGITPYLPSPNWKKAHPFDRLCALGKQQFYIVECKTKEARLYYPDTGININSFNQYMFISNKYKIKVFIFFIDINSYSMYGNHLGFLEEKRVIDINTYETIRRNGIDYKPARKINKEIEYPLVQKGIRYWPLEAMRKYTEIQRSEIAYLSKLTTKSDKYNPIYPIIQPHRHVEKQYA